MTGAPSAARAPGAAWCVRVLALGGAVGSKAALFKPRREVLHTEEAAGTAGGDAGSSGGVLVVAWGAPTAFDVALESPPPAPAPPPHVDGAAADARPKAGKGRVPQPVLNWPRLEGCVVFQVCYRVCVSFCGVVPRAGGTCVVGGS